MNNKKILIFVICIIIFIIGIVIFQKYKTNTNTVSNNNTILQGNTFTNDFSSNTQIVESFEDD